MLYNLNVTNGVREASAKETKPSITLLSATQLDYCSLLRRWYSTPCVTNVKAFILVVVYLFRYLLLRRSSFDWTKKELFIQRHL